ncbi:hypothetical protein M3175_19790 [Robertmurraya korlensis]|uniref:hypothetical protein n=1 Tax=Robertmurraya korlensis TaxID=519977 RepID=UPI0020409F8E|nr:hypothetical protein [Robertmurraya korlensis]MCM3602984.1 hypothetical protein [Robertmurraya korlensis]
MAVRILRLFGLDLKEVAFDCPNQWIIRTRHERKSSLSVQINGLFGLDLKEFALGCPNPKGSVSPTNAIILSKLNIPLFKRKIA